MSSTASSSKTLSKPNPELQKYIENLSFSAVMDGVVTKDLKFLRIDMPSHEYNFPFEFLGFSMVKPGTANRAAAAAVANFLWFSGKGIGPKKRPHPPQTFAALTERPVMPRPPNTGATKPDVLKGLEAMFTCFKSYEKPLPNKGYITCVLAALIKRWGHVTAAGVNACQKKLWTLYKAVVNGEVAMIHEKFGNFARVKTETDSLLEEMIAVLRQGSYTKAWYDDHERKIHDLDESVVSSQSDNEDILLNLVEDLVQSACLQYTEVDPTRLRAIVSGNVTVAARLGFTTRSAITDYVIAELKVLIAGPLEYQEICERDHIKTLKEAYAVIDGLNTELNVANEALNALKALNRTVSGTNRRLRLEIEATQATGLSSFFSFLGRIKDKTRSFLGNFWPNISLFGF